MIPVRRTTAPATTPNKDKMGYCPRCGGNSWEVENSDVEAWSDDTPFPTITVRFECRDCDHVIEVSYDRMDNLHNHSNKEYMDWGYDPDPDGMLDPDKE
jgi:hypothetical protein